MKPLVSGPTGIPGAAFPRIALQSGHQVVAWTRRRTVHALRDAVCRPREILS